MWKFICAGMSLLVSISAQADTCPLPRPDSGDPYAILAGSPQRELRLLLSEYMFMHRWKMHSEAFAAGFRPGDRVYGEALKPGGKFSAERTAEWRRTYEKSKRKQFVDTLGAKVDMTTVDAQVVGWALQVCLSDRVWSQVAVINDCRFAFTAGIVPGDGPRLTVNPLRFEVLGGRCGRWPQRPLSIKGDGVQCVRSGDGEVTLALTTDHAGITQQTLSSRTQPKMPAEPREASRLSAPLSEVIRLSRSHDYRLQQLGRGCSACSLYAADIRPSAADAVILRATTVSSSGTGWQACPAALRCGVYEFSPPEEQLVSGCTGLSVCRVWRLAESEGDATDVIQLTYQRPESTCVNCPPNIDFQSAHRQWQEARDSAPARCQVFTDLPAQSMNAIQEK